MTTLPTNDSLRTDLKTVKHFFEFARSLARASSGAALPFVGWSLGSHWLMTD